MSSQHLAEYVTKLIDDYIAQTDWYIHENANRRESYHLLKGYLTRKVMSIVIQKYLREDWVKLHAEGYIHIHKLPDSLFVPYCLGLSLERILLTGYVGTPTCRPAKHFLSALQHIVHYAYTLSQEWTGAQAFNMFDLYLAPFIARDNLTYERVKQYIQGFIYECNMPYREEHQAPFINITLLYNTAEELLKRPAIIGGQAIDASLGDFLEYAEWIWTALLSEMCRGDAAGNPFTFPIITVPLHRKLFDSFVWRFVLRTSALRGSVYYLNAAACDISTLFAMCCRLNIDLQTIASVRGIWSIPDNFGSIGVVTINLPRATYLAKRKGDVEKYLYDELLHFAKIARDILQHLRQRYRKSMEIGFMPMSKAIGINLDNFYSTFGVLGQAEAFTIFVDDPLAWKIENEDYARDYVKFNKLVIGTLTELCREFMNSDNVPYNVEQVPAESAAYRLAKLDWEKFPEMRDYIPVEVPRRHPLEPVTEKVPFYSSQNTPSYTTWSLDTQIEVESEVQPLFTGGVVKHIFLGQKVSEDYLSRFLRFIHDYTKIVYLSITPTQTVCLSCGWWEVGIYEKCPKCGSQHVEIWTRIVGYYAPLSRWNIGRRAEFWTRKHYTVEELRQATIAEV